MKLKQLSVVIAFLSPILANAAPVAYSISQLNTPSDFSFSVASALNNSGQVAGSSAFIDTSPEYNPEYVAAAHATTWLSGNSVTLTGGAGKYSYANAINDLGQVAGISYTKLPFLLERNTQGLEGLEFLPPSQEPAYDAQATVWHNGTVTTLNGLSNQYGAANAINNQGQVVGWSFNAQNQQTATLWQNGNASALFTNASATSAANDINDNGYIVGAIYQDSTSYAAFWNSNNELVLLDTLGGIGSEAFAINNSNVAVGWGMSSDSRQHATLWDNGEVIDLGTLGGYASYAYGINNLGQVVGSYIEDRDGSWEEFAVLWDNGTAINLNTLLGSNTGITLVSANGINDQGWIIAQGVDSNGHYSSYLLAPVPEPETYALLLAGLGLIGIVRRKVRALNA